MKSEKEILEEADDEPIIPEEFRDIYGKEVTRYLIFGANIVDINDIKISTNIGECDVSISFLPKYL